jgi:hypothetical protein
MEPSRCRRTSRHSPARDGCSGSRAVYDTIGVRAPHRLGRSGPEGHIRGAGAPGEDARGGDKGRACRQRQPPHLLPVSPRVAALPAVLWGSTPSTDVAASQARGNGRVPQVAQRGVRHTVLRRKDRVQDRDARGPPGGSDSARPGGQRHRAHTAVIARARRGASGPGCASGSGRAVGWTRASSNGGER